MDYAACNVVYVDCTAPEDKLARKEDVLSPVTVQENANHTNEDSGAHENTGSLKENLRTLLETFSEGWCRIPMV